MKNLYTVEQLFGLPRAEDEAAWLDQIFVPPSNLAEYGGQRSTAIIGTGGSGKTTLRLMLVQQRQAERLIIPWLPTLLPDDCTKPGEYVETDLLRACAQAIVRALGSEPSRFTNAALWVQEYICSLVHGILVGSAPVNRLIGLLSADLNSDGQNLVTRLLRPTIQPEPLGATGSVQLLEELTAAISQLGFSTAWVIVDGLERLEARINDRDRTLKALVATLSLFDIPHLAVKLLAPESLQPAIINSSSFHRRRLDVHHIRWREPQLINVIERRLALLSGQSNVTLDSVVPIKTILPWINEYGTTPRDWIEAFRPLAQAYLAAGASQSLDLAQHNQLLRRSIPTLRVEDGRVFVGVHEILNIQPQSMRILFYMIERTGRLCSREELYYEAIRGLEIVPRTREDVGYEEEMVWRSQIDTAIHRLRQSIEPDPQHPIFLVTERGRGLRLYQYPKL